MIAHPNDILDHLIPGRNPSQWEASRLQDESQRIW